MTRRGIIFLVVAAALGLLSLALPHVTMTHESRSKGLGTYEELSVGLIRYRAYRVSPRHVELHWHKANDEPLQSLQTLRRELLRGGREPEFMMNAGIYEPGFVPSGLHIEGGRELTPLNEGSGRGNFYMKPNGVFSIEGSVAHVQATEDYAAGSHAPRLAVQSGPLLLSEGEIPPEIDEGQGVGRVRNGVCIDPESGEVVFLMTDRGSLVKPSLSDFAWAFSKIGCRDALYLDGFISQMWIRGVDDTDTDGAFAAMLSVSR